MTMALDGQIGQLNASAAFAPRNGTPVSVETGKLVVALCDICPQ
jgi:hypothetical protein